MMQIITPTAIGTRSDLNGAIDAVADESVETKMSGQGTETFLFHPVPLGWDRETPINYVNVRAFISGTGNFGIMIKEGDTEIVPFTFPIFGNGVDPFGLIIGLRIDKSDNWSFMDARGLRIRGVRYSL